MTGLKLLADRVEGKLMSRATAGHAASIGISGALSFACADLIASLGGWRAAFIVAAASAALAWLLVAWAVPRPVRSAPVPGSDHRLFDFRPVLRNRSAMAYAIVYAVHTLEMNALRGWGVAFSRVRGDKHPHVRHGIFPCGRPHRSWTGRNAGERSG